MNDIRLLWKESIARALTSLLPEGAESVTAERIAMETPPDPNLGDLGFPLLQRHCAPLPLKSQRSCCPSCKPILPSREKEK